MKPHRGLQLSLLTGGALMLLVVAPPAARAQRVTETRENPVVEVAKWSAGALALAAGAFAFVIQNDAEDRYQELERFCADSPTVCRELTPDGAYADPSLEATWQDIREDYRDARLLLIGAHVFAATSVVLFIVDLPRGATPANIPYEPPALRVGVRPGGGIEAAIRYPVSNILTRSP